MHLALYRLERPENFDQIIGQEHIVKILKNQIKKGQVSQAYLFTGTRGTGKTSTARILAKAINCTGEDIPCGKCTNCKSIRDGAFMDVIELDAASNNGVDDLRAIIDSVQYPPAMGRYKVYIIDEVHMLTPAAENAFLKTLEEPPEYAIFILATTDPEKVKSTIKSRCMTLNFRRVSEKDLVKGMKRICEKYDVSPKEEALNTIARKADGSVRDALSILEQCIETGEKNFTEEEVYYYTESLGSEFYLELTEAVIDGDISSAIVKINDMLLAGKDAKEMLSDFLTYLRNLLVAKCTNNAEVLIGISSENIDRLKNQADKISTDEIKNWIKYLSKKVNQARYSNIPRIILEVAIIDMVDKTTEDIDEDEKKEISASKKKLNIKKDLENKINTKERVDDKKTKNSNKVKDINKTKIIKDKEAKKEVKEENSNKIKGEANGSIEKEKIKSNKEEIEDKSKEESETCEMDFDEMWNKVLDEVATGDIGFNVIVGSNSKITDYRNGEIVLMVKPSKLSFAKTSQKMLDEAAKKLFGKDSYFTLKSGEISDSSYAGINSNDKNTGRNTKKPQNISPNGKSRNSSETTGENIEKTDNMKDDDIDKTLNNISEAFGIEPSKIDILG
ncbi:DNA polymerase III subunit gamma/tau [Alterileibacterium massiliense]|uniref:DNA polymerase III subunit gamma/tau n=1 Tax=Alterileibacterium massiliense TaxID=1870997 RepID=UPI0008DAEC07|nr:DNA polymerase III subunit gamma/tau [Alterileibacterium massiliense]